MSSVTSQGVKRSMRGSWYALFVLLFLYVLSLMDRQIIALMVTPLRRDLGLSDVQVGLLEGFAFVVMYTLAAIPLGWAVDRFSRRIVIFLGLTVWSLSCSGAGFVTTFAGLFASRVGVGVGEAALSPGAHSMLSDLFPRRKLSMALGVFVIGANIGVAVSYGLGGTLIHWLSVAEKLQLPLLGEFRPWQLAFLIAGAPGVALCWLLFTIPEPVRQRQGGAASSQAVFAPVVRYVRTQSGALICVFVGFALNNLLGYTVLSWTPAFLERRFGWHIGEIGPALGILLGGAGICAMLASGAIADRFYTRGRHDISVRMSVVAMLVAAPLALCAFLAPTPQICLLFLTLTYFCTSSTVPNAATSLQLIAPNELRGRLAAGYIFLSNMVGQGMGPVTVGFITEHVFHNHRLVGYSLATVLPCAAVAGSVLLLIGLRSYGRALDQAEGLAAARVDGADVGNRRFSDKGIGVGRPLAATNDRFDGRSAE
jgi:MFS family permease